MKQLLFIILLVLPAPGLFGQKLVGIYFGEILSPRNVFLIKSKGQTVTGLVYLTKAESLEFTGTYVNNILTGSIHLANGAELPLEGKLDFGKLIVTRTDDNKVERTLFRVTYSTKYNIDDLFSDEYDAQLLGRWETSREIDVSGVTTMEGEALGKFAQVFEKEGRGYTKLIKVPKKFEQNGITNNPDLFTRMEITWRTKGTELTMFTPSGPIFLQYVIKDDTLKVVESNGYVIYYKRK